MIISEFCAAFFNKSLWPSVSKSEKERHSFILLRFISIKFPHMVNIMNHKDINQLDAIEFWHSYLAPRFNQIPGWFWITSGKNKDKIKKKVKEKKLTQEYDAEILNAYCNQMNIVFSTLQDDYEIAPKETLKELKSFKEVYDSRK